MRYNSLSSIQTCMIVMNCMLFNMNSSWESWTSRFRIVQIPRENCCVKKEAFPQPDSNDESMHQNQQPLVACVVKVDALLPIKGNPKKIWLLIWKHLMILSTNLQKKANISRRGGLLQTSTSFFHSWPVESPSLSGVTTKTTQKGNEPKNLVSSVSNSWGGSVGFPRDSFGGLPGKSGCVNGQES